MGEVSESILNHTCFALKFAAIPSTWLGVNHGSKILFYKETYVSLKI